MTQLLFFTSRVRKYIKMAIDFLFTRVRRTDKDDQRKLVKLLRYIRGTLNLPLILRDDRMHVIKWWVYESFDANPDFRGYTGASISIGPGSIMELLWKQKINGRISTEANIVGAEDALPQCLWLI